MPDIKGAVKFTVESPCTGNDKFRFGEALNRTIPAAIRQLFDSYCNGGPAYLSNWSYKNFSIVKCQEGYSKLLVDIEFRDKGKVECINSGDIYARHDDKMVREARPFTTKYVYKNDDGDIVSVTLPTDLPHDRADDHLRELNDLAGLIEHYKTFGSPAAELIEALKYISNNSGRFEGISSIKPDLVLALMIKRNSTNALYSGVSRFNNLLQQQPSVDANGSMVPELARYYYAFMAYQQ